MKNNMKKGISIIILTITVAVILILAKIIFDKISYIDEHLEAMQFINDLSIIEARLQELDGDTSFFIYSKGVLLGTELNPPDTVGSQTYPSEANTGNWYRTAQSNLMENLRLEGLKLRIESIGSEGNPIARFLVNYEEGKVVSKAGFKYQGQMYYTLDEILEVIDI